MFGFCPFEISAYVLYNYLVMSLDQRKKRTKNLKTNDKVFEKTCKELGSKNTFPLQHQKATAAGWTRTNKKGLCIWVSQEAQKLKKQEKWLKSHSSLGTRPDKCRAPFQSWGTGNQGKPVSHVKVKKNKSKRKTKKGVIWKLRERVNQGVG